MLGWIIRFNQRQRWFDDDAFARIKFERHYVQPDTTYSPTRWKQSETYGSGVWSSSRTTSLYRVYVLQIGDTFAVGAIAKYNPRHILEIVLLANRDQNRKCSN